MNILEDYDKIVDEIKNTKSNSNLWKDVVLNYLSAYKSLENKDLDLFKKSVNTSDLSSYLLFTSPEFLGVKYNKTLTSDHPFRGSVYLEFPGAEKVESLGSIVFCIYYKSKNITKNSDDWLFLKSVVDYLKNIFFPFFEEKFNNLNNISLLNAINLYSDFYQLWDLYVSFLTIDDLVEFKLNREKFFILLENLIVRFFKKNNQFPNYKNYLRKLSPFFRIIDEDVFKTALPEFEMVNVDRLLSDIVASSLSDVQFRNAIYLIDNYPERLMDDIDVFAWSVIYTRFFNSRDFRKDYAFGTVDTWKECINPMNENKSIMVKLIERLNSLFISKYHCIKGVELKPEFLIALYWFNFNYSLNEFKSLNSSLNNRTLKNLLKKEAIIKNDIENFKEENKNSVAMNLLEFLEL